jgi:hypothetical protein
MSGLDELIAGSSDGTTLLMVVAVPAVLGLRHATDPDHLAAVTALIATGDERSGRAARRLGFVRGLGHATTLFAFGLPIVFYSAYLPEPVQQGAETAVGVMIVALAVCCSCAGGEGRSTLTPTRMSTSTGTVSTAMGTRPAGARRSVPTRSASSTGSVARPVSACCC